jgi:hypothetical protein
MSPAVPVGTRIPLIRLATVGERVRPVCGNRPHGSILVRRWRVTEVTVPGIVIGVPWLLLARLVGGANSHLAICT